MDTSGIKYRTSTGTKKIGCHHDVRFPKTNYLKTNLLKQIKKISLYVCVTIFLLMTLQNYTFLQYHPNKKREKITKIAKNQQKRGSYYWSPSFLSSSLSKYKCGRNTLFDLYFLAFLPCFTSCRAVPSELPASLPACRR